MCFDKFLEVIHCEWNDVELPDVVQLITETDVVKHIFKFKVITLEIIQ